MTFELTPYARAMGIAHAHFDDGLPVLVLPFEQIVVGRPGTLHGGATSGLLETAGYAALRTELDRAGRLARLKPINVTVQFLSAARPEPTYAIGRVTRMGRRNANIDVEAWQHDRHRPIATAVMNVLMIDDSSADDAAG